MEQQPSAQAIHEFFTHLALRGSREIREHLKIDYLTSEVQKEISSDSRKLYLHGALKDLEKAALRYQAESLFLIENQNNTPKPQDLFDVHLTNVILQEKIDTIGLWCRKLSEILIDLIGFSKANIEAQYKHFLLIEEIYKTASTQRNLKDYYECKNKWIENKIKHLQKEADAEKTKTNSSFFWYLKENPYKKISFNERLLAILPHTEGFQRLPLRDYDEAFSKMSTSLHPNNSFNESAIHLKHLELSMTRLGILFMHVVFAIKKLLDAPPLGGVLERVENLLKNNKYPEELLNKTMVQPEIKINDCVLVFGNYLAQVVSQKKSKFGYMTFSVKFLEANGLLQLRPENIEDEFIARDLLLLGPYEQIFKRQNNISDANQSAERQEVDIT
jgi:hypothetical protein